MNIPPLNVRISWYNLQLNIVFHLHIKNYIFCTADIGYCGDRPRIQYKHVFLVKGNILKS